MNKEFPEIQKLLEMRGQSAPGDEYFEEFLDEFHRRQRQDLMKRSARSLFMERIAVWIREMGSAKWIYGAGIGYALLMVGFFVWPKDTQAKDGLDRVSWDVPEQKILHFEPAKEDEDEKPKHSEF
ncbi:MAG: hypothetical protein OSB65_11440 [Roseibacillus sp.]|nr:hypothetical protein [Roseibacillus sp.]